MSGDELRLDGWAVPAELEALHELCEQGREAWPTVSAEAFMMMETAVIEIAGNVVEHGRPIGQVRWTFTLRVRDAMLEGVLSDDGREYAGDLSSLMPDPLSESGRGLALAQAALDELRYAREDERNVWTMRRAAQPA